MNPVSHRIAPLSFIAGLSACLLLVGAAGCNGTPRSQQVRQAARDRYDEAGAQIICDQARQAFQSGQFEPALTHIDRAIARFPKEASFYLLRGRILHEMSRVDQARECFAKAAELDPRKPEPHYFLGIVYQRWRQYEDALGQYAIAAKLDPNKLHFVAAEVEMLTVMGRFDVADKRLADVSQRFEFSPVIDRLRADVAKMRGDEDLCSQMLERAAMRETAKPDVIEELAYARYSKGDWQGSLSALDDPVLAKRIGRPDLARLRARNLLLMGRPDEARNVLLAIKGDNDPQGRTMLLLGHAAWRIGDWGRVRDCGEALTRLHPTYADGFMFLGAAEHAAGHLAESTANFEQAVALDPSRDVARKLLGEVVARANAKQPSGDLAIRRPTAAAGAVRDEAP